MSDSNHSAPTANNQLSSDNKTYTSKQEEVINITNGYNMVLAGPGCGKTDILAERIARAYEKNNVSLSDMLCLTFTNRAARGMYDRIQSRLGNDAAELFVGNIHRYCSHFLFDEGIVSAETSIMDEDDTNEILASELSDSDIKELIGYREVDGYYGKLVDMDWEIVNGFLGIDRHPTGSSGMIKVVTANAVISEVRYKILDIEHLLYQVLRKHPRDDFYRKEFLDDNLIKYGYGLFSSFEDECLKASYNSESYRYENNTTKVISLAKKLMDYKERNGLIDFDDLLLYTYDAYFYDKEHTYKRYKWIQIDEIQDLSRFQLSLVDLLTKKEEDFVVLYLGDEQQAIYSFMGASLESLNYLKSRCKNIYHLDKNFRSPKYLLDIYNEYAIKDLNVDRDFLPEPKDDKKAGFYDVCIHSYESEEEEVSRIYESILPFLRNEEHANERTALLVPWNVDANSISDRLKQDKISHFKISGIDSFQTVHMKTLMAHFNAVYNDFNLIAWSRILKQTYAVDTYKDGRLVIEKMRKIGMCPSDLLRENGTYLYEFTYLFDNHEIVIFDTETTGVDVFNDDIVQIAAYKVKNGQIVPGSFFNIIMETEKEIPAKLGKDVNPLVEIYNNTQNKLSREQGLTMFMNYIGNDILLGHNVCFDYHILKYNLKKYCACRYDGFEAHLIDTLKLAHLISPRLRKYKLGYLVERFDLLGANKDNLKYHQAEEDIKATFELAKYCRKKAEDVLGEQVKFLQEPQTRYIIDEWNRGYKDSYYNTKNNLYVQMSEGSNYAIIDEMRYASEELQNLCEFKLVDSFDSILEFLRTDVISNPDPEPNALITHFSNHLMDMSTYREADLCSSSSFKEKLFVSTVHKAKGLEFENVIVMRSIVGRYPHFAHDTAEKKEEDKRLFYVAISRAMKRLIVSGVEDKFTPYLYSILHNFTLRSGFFDGYGNRVIAEIGYDYLRLRKNCNGKVMVRDYDSISNAYKYNGSINNQFDILNVIKDEAYKSDAFDSTDKVLSKFNIIPIAYN